MKQSVRGLEKCKIVAVLRRSSESLSKPLHVRTPDTLRRDVDQKLKRQRFLVVQIVHVRGRDLVRRATTDVLPDATTQLSGIAVEVQTLVALRRRRSEHRRQCDVSHRGKR